MEIRIIRFYRHRQMSFLTFKQLNCRRFTRIIHIFFIRESVQANSRYVSNVVFFHNLINSIENKIRHTVVRFHGFVYYFSQARIVAHEKPRINGNTVTADAGHGEECLHGDAYCKFLIISYTSILS